jgi:hypothetical protein
MTLNLFRAISRAPTEMSRLHSWGCRLRLFEHVRGSSILAPKKSTNGLAIPTSHHHMLLSPRGNAHFRPCSPWHEQGIASLANIPLDSKSIQRKRDTPSNLLHAPQVEAGYRWRAPRQKIRSSPQMRQTPSSITLPRCFLFMLP